ncbi:MAG: sporulation transcriptional regulator SpoIIID [Clostridia bacterium]|nr:sporulation transcriptional regulator SpoIIID [Clostridia bacterium]
MLADYMIKTQSTVRDAATKFGISKSTVHKDVTERLRQRNIMLFDSVRDLLDKNKSERHIRGGEATKNKYIKKMLNKRTGS